MVDKRKKRSGFPSQLAPDKEKNSMEYGLDVGKAIEAEWFNKDTTNAQRYQTTLAEYHRLRLYGRGEQSTKKYKSEFKIDGDLSYVNIDWAIVPIIPKFVDILTNGISNRLFDINVKSIDPLASKERGEYLEELVKSMTTADEMVQVASILGDPSILPPEDLPETSEELELHMQLNYKQGIEIAEEEAINYVFEKNDYEHLKRRVVRDIVDIGIGCIKHTFDETNSIQTMYVDPAKMVYSYTEDPQFKDCYYWGEVKDVTLVEIRKMFPNITDEQLEEINSLSNSNQDYGISSTTVNYKDNNTYQILNFVYKTFNNSVYKKKTSRNGGKRLSRKDDTFNPPKTKGADFEKLAATREVLYEGTLILGTNIILKWDLMKNMVRPKANTSKVVSPYVMHAPNMYKGKLDSMVKRMTSFADMIQLTHLKIQQVLMRMVPDGIMINVDAINEIDLGGGSKYNPKEALRMYFQTGSVVGRTMTQEGDLNHSQLPITPLSSNSGNDKLGMLINSYNYYLNMIRDVTGLNEASDGSTPSEYSLPGVQKLAAANSNTATRHIQMACNDITRRLAEGVSIRIADAIEYSPTKQELIQAIGKYNTANLRDISRLHLHNFGIFIHLHPDEEEKQMLEQNIQVAISSGQIETSDAIDVRRITNVKLANELLKFRQKKKFERDQEAQMAQQEAAAQANAQAAQQAAEAAAQTEMIKAEAQIKIEQAKHQFQMESLMQEVKAKKELMREEAMYKMQMAEAAANGAMQKFKEGEDRKDKRQADAAEQNSQLIEQRNTKGPARKFSGDYGALVDGIKQNNVVQGEFESANDNLNPVGDLGAFDPK